MTGAHSRRPPKKIGRFVKRAKTLTRLGLDPRTLSVLTIRDNSGVTVERPRLCVALCHETVAFLLENRGVSTVDGYGRPHPKGSDASPNQIYFPGAGPPASPPLRRLCHKSWRTLKAPCCLELLAPCFLRNNHSSKCHPSKNPSKKGTGQPSLAHQRENSKRAGYNRPGGKWKT